MKEFEGKKLLVLGGSKNLVPLIDMGHSLGYYVIVCDWTKDNPGNLIADKHYQVSVCDFDVILNIAKEERIDGICSNYEVAMPTVAYVSEKLNLVGNPYKSIVNVIEKDKFRNLQKRAGVFAPKHIVTCSYEYLKKKIKEFEFPVILKPCESSATRGVTKILKNDLTTIKEAFLSCQSLSRNNKVCLEEFVEMQSLVVLDGDVFVYGDDFIWNGLFYSTRSKNAPMVPTTQTYPLSLPEEKLNIVKDTLKKVFKTAGIRFGEYNVEMYFNGGGELFIIEINVRQGGNGIPIMIKEHSGIDFTKLLVSLSVGDESYYNEISNSTPLCQYLCRHPVYSDKNGKYSGIHISKELSDFVYKIDEIKQMGDDVHCCNNALDVVGFVNLRFDSLSTQLKYYDKLEDFISVKLK